YAGQNVGYQNGYNAVQRNWVFARNCTVRQGEGMLLSSDSLKHRHRYSQNVKALVYDSDGSDEEIHKILKEEIFPIINQVDTRLQNFEIQFLKEAAKFVRDFKSLAKEADDICLLRLGQLELNEKCEECKYDKISYDKAYNDMQQKIERLQAQLGDQKGKSQDTPCVSNTLDPLSQKLENENVELEFQELGQRTVRTEGHSLGAIQRMIGNGTALEYDHVAAILGCGELSVIFNGKYFDTKGLFSFRLGAQSVLSWAGLQLKIRDKRNAYECSGLDLTYAPSTITTQKPNEGELDLLFEYGMRGFRLVVNRVHLLQELLGLLKHLKFFDFRNGQLLTTAVHNTDLLYHQPATIADNVPNAMFDENTFVNPFATPSTSDAESSSSQYVDPMGHAYVLPTIPSCISMSKDHLWNS
ncbi:hypothetical protein Tco_0636274, partial [Tanacetum coccineum]